METNPLNPQELPDPRQSWKFPAEVAPELHPMPPPPARPYLRPKIALWMRSLQPPAFIVLIGALVGMVLAGIGFGAAVLVFYGMGGTWHDSYGPAAPHGPCRAGTMYLRTDPPGHPSFYICTDHPWTPQNPQTIHQ